MANEYMIAVGDDKTLEIVTPGGEALVLGAEECAEIYNQYRWLAAREELLKLPMIKKEPSLVENINRITDFYIYRTDLYQKVLNELTAEDAVRLILLEQPELSNLGDDEDYDY